MAYLFFCAPAPMVSAWAGTASAAPDTSLTQHIRYAGLAPCHRQQYHFPKASE